MDLAEIKEPVEVYELADGDKESIVRLLRSEKLLTRWTRDALADYFEGKPVRKKKKGRPKDKNWFMKYAINEWAVQDYRETAKKLKKNKQFYGHADSVAEDIAKSWGLPLQSFLDYLKRSKKKK